MAIEGNRMLKENHVLHLSDVYPHCVSVRQIISVCLRKGWLVTSLKCNFAERALCSDTDIQSIAGMSNDRGKATSIDNRCISVVTLGSFLSCLKLKSLS